MGFTRHFADSEPSRAAVDALRGVTLVEFGAPWCGFCIGAQSMIESTLVDHPKVRHLKIADGRGKRLGRSFKIKLWPTLVVLRDGEEVARLVRPGDDTALRRALG